VTTTGEQPLRTLILDPDLGPVELHEGAATTVTSVFGSEETAPWLPARPATD